MRILACIKRVPAPGARIPLTDDQRAIDTRNLGFAVSPHEECAVEEAVQIAERTGGSATVLTLGPPEAEEQLRAALAVGADEAALVTVDASPVDPQATAAALAEAVTRLEAESGAFDLILVGNESADAGNYQVGIRLARLLGRPSVMAIKGIDLEAGSLRAKRETPSGLEVFGVPLPAVVGVREGINLPRYPTMPSRMKARKAEITIAAAAGTPGGLRFLRHEHPPQETSETEILGTDAAAARRVADLIESLGVGT